MMPSPPNATHWTKPFHASAVYVQLVYLEKKETNIDLALCKDYTKECRVGGEV
jgi:hypothetical protein